MSWTYRELLEELQQMGDAQLDSNVTVYDAESCEFYPVTDLDYADEDEDVLDADHPFLSFNAKG